MNRNLIDINIRLDRAGAYAAILLAARLGDMASYKTALAQTYGTPVVARRVFENTVDQVSDYAYAEIDRRVVLGGSENDTTLHFWAMVIENYESRHDPIGPPDPDEAIKFRAEQMGG